MTPDRQTLAGAMTSQWCRAHLREATHTDADGNPCCDPAAGGIMTPCNVSRDFGDLVKCLAARMAKHPPPLCPVVETWTPGLYSRQTTMPPGLYTSMPHKTRHQFAILRGRVQVISETEGTVEYVAPFVGITEPGTQRVLRVLETTTWATFHATEETTTEAVAASILDLDAMPADCQQWRLATPTLPDSTP